MATAPHDLTALEARLGEKLAREVGEAAESVGRALGAGLGASVYREALELELSDRGLHAEVRPPFVVRYRGRAVGQFTGDLLLEGRLLVELAEHLDRDALETGRARLRAAG